MVDRSIDHPLQPKRRWFLKSALAIGAVGGAVWGAILGFGIGAAASFSHRQFAQQNHKQGQAVLVWILEVGQDIVCLSVAGLIIGAWV